LGRRKIQLLEERDGEVGKVCTDCFAWKPLDEYSKCKGSQDGKRSVCKRCDIERVRKYRKDNEGKYKEASRNYHAKNKEKLNARNKAYREKNNEQERERMKRWRDDNKEHTKEYSRTYAVENREKIREIVNRWCAKNREVTILYQQQRRARKKRLPDDFTLEQRNDVLEYFKNGCALTGDTEDVHFDHVIPISIGHGGTTYGNMIPLRADLNRSKHNTNIFEWFEANRQHFKLSEEKFEDLIEYLAEMNMVSIEEYKDHVNWCHENPHHFDENGEAI
jgi:hypothetical protein